MSLHLDRNAAPDKNGSVLVPVVAAMLLLSLCGSALADLFAAQRLQSVLSVESAQAYWVAEGGAWHAAHEGAALPSTTDLAGGTYTVAQDGASYTSTGLRGQARRTVTLDHAAGGGSTGTSPSDPLDIAASVATARKVGNDKFELDLVSLNEYPVVISSFSVTAVWWTWPIDKLKLDGDDIWKDNSGVWMPTGVLPVNEGDPEDRLILAEEAPTLRVELRYRPFWPINYTLVLRYTNGATSTLSFPIQW